MQDEHHHEGNTDGDVQRKFVGVFENTLLNAREASDPVVVAQCDGEKGDERDRAHLDPEQLPQLLQCTYGHADQHGNHHGFGKVLENDIKGSARPDGEGDANRHLKKEQPQELDRCRYFRLAISHHSDDEREHSKDRSHLRHWNVIQSRDEIFGPVVVQGTKRQKRAKDKRAARPGSHVLKPRYPDAGTLSASRLCGLHCHECVLPIPPDPPAGLLLPKFELFHGHDDIVRKRQHPNPEHLVAGWSPLLVLVE